MSTASKVVCLCACGISIGIIFYVHYKQNYDLQKLHEGVIRDIEQQRRRKAENIYALQQQIDLTKELKKSENSIK